MSTVRQATIDLFRSHGLTTWFGNPGSSELTLLEDFPDDFRYLLGLQEMVPAGMADAYSQITGRPAVVNLHTAPGMGNAQGALYNAFVNKTPLIVTAGNQRRFMQNQYCLLTNIEATTVPKPFVKWAAEPAIASETPAVLAHAIHLATTPPTGPVFVSLPMDDLQAELDDTQAADIAAVSARKVTHAVGFPADLADQISARLEAAAAPALIVGGDVERYGAWDAVIGLAERTRSMVWTAPLTGWSGFPENHPLYQGMLPPGAGWISQALTGRDLILVIGAPVFRYYPKVPGPYLPPGADLIHITNDPDEAARAPVGDAIIADLRSAAEALLAAATPSRRPAPPPRALIPDVEHAEAPLKPETLWAAVGRAAPPETLWVSEAGSNELAITTGIRPGKPFSHLSAAGGGLGFGLPASVGAQLAAPDRPVVALMGDGSMHYAITALWTAARYRIPVTIVVASNGEYGVLKEFGKWEKTAGVPGLDLPGLNVVATAASYGVDAHEARTTDEVIELVESGIADRERPTLINARTIPVDA
ncbi:benzoylformate decarboxylase [Mycobacterium heidelbergense]|uniref:acetolactate synthase n=1 Tax=Mycobacterium heidelbergense TaxID=53376 RepID=A0A1X0DV38_MYCHE|nr:benzoylformate decarboxylase [Mycobacterium heidelbergense]MCV7052833.1 benzoylformate decarboxylase [Mycobacterium heidelbergense]ORA76207.1 benzoylformate decarboxylase [Mycobacterium heidelbergense]BBZ51012.1 benzoylformate decarboxylase [Mycobacterium heidelbergense]